jgi:hypothetical protein
MRIKSWWIIYCFPILLLALQGCSKAGLPESKDATVSAMVDELSTDSIRHYVEWLESYPTRFFAHDNHRQIAMDLKNKFIQIGYPDAHVDSFFYSADWYGTMYETWQYNVVARIEGSSEPGKLYIMGAHYDCVVDEGNPMLLAPGADDNASGVAGMLEVARVMKKSGFSPKYSIEFIAFAAEECELSGSTDYANNATNQNTNIVMMLNNDMIGYASGSDPTAWTVNIMDYQNSNALRKKAVRYGELYTTLNFKNKNGYNKEGDSYSFYKAGFESLFFISFDDNTSYHTGNDLSGNCNYSFCREVSAISCAMLAGENI